MEGEGVNSFRECALCRFISDVWPEFEEGINGVQVRDEDFALYLMWALDGVKSGDGDFVSKWRSRIYSALRSKTIECSFKSDKEDLEYITNLVCAFVLYCYGLVLKGNSDNQDVYCKLVGGLGEHWSDVRGLRESIEFDADATGLRNWLLAYMESDWFYTVSDKIEWADAPDAGLPAVCGRPGANVQVQVNIDTFINERGAVYNDNSNNVQIVKGDGEDWKLLQ